MGDVISFDRRQRQPEQALPAADDSVPAPQPVTFRVLVADDEEWTRHLLRSYLLNEGVTVETVRTGDEAAERFLATAPDIVFLDVEMPGRSGLDVLALIPEQTTVVREIISRLDELREAGVQGMVWRMLTDDRKFDTANYHGMAERYWGLLRADGTPKPAFEPFRTGMRAEAALQSRRTERDTFRAARR